MRSSPLGVRRRTCRVSVRSRFGMGVTGSVVEPATDRGRVNNSDAALCILGVPVEPRVLSDPSLGFRLGLETEHCLPRTTSADNENVNAGAVRAGNDGVSGHYAWCAPLRLLSIPARRRFSGSGAKMVRCAFSEQTRGLETPDQADPATRSNALVQRSLYHAARLCIPRPLFPCARSGKRVHGG